MEPRLKVRYDSEVRPALLKEFGYQNPMQVPRLQKIVLNISLKEAIQNAKLLEAAAEELAAITGQKPIIRKARISIGVKVTLRRERMWEFFDRLVTLAIPRIRDFRGVQTNGFDGRGNFSMGLTEQIIFPALESDKIKKVSGMNISFVTTAPTDAEARSLLEKIGLPFRK